MLVVGIVVAPILDSGIQPEKINVQAMGSADPIVFCGNMTEEQMIACLAPNRRTEVRFFFPRAHTQGIVLAREKLSTTAGDYISISAASVEVAAPTSMARASRVKA